MKKQLLAIVLCAALTACASEPPLPPPATLDYSSLGKISVDTQDLRVVNRVYDASKKQAYKPKLTEAVTRWASDRLQPVGTVGHATLIIKDASVTEQVLPVSSSYENWFTRQQASKLIGRIEVEIDAQAPTGPLGSISGLAKAYASHYVTLPENPNDAERAEAYKSLLGKLMEDLNKNLEQAIRQHLSRFIGSQSSQSDAAVPPPAAALTQPLPQAPTPEAPAAPVLPPPALTTAATAPIALVPPKTQASVIPPVGK